MNKEKKSLVHLREIHREFQNGNTKIEVLKGIDLNIDAGEYVAIMGRSGAGKSTLMNILGCLDLPSRGTYELDGISISNLDDDTLSSVRGRTIGFIFQSFHLLKNLTICDNVSLPMEYQNKTSVERREKAEFLLTQVGLGHRLEHLPSELSGGERQRVAIARAMSNDPKILLADEPTGNLDSAARDQILELFEALNTDHNVTLIMVTHDELIGKLAHRKIIIEDGRVIL